MLRPRFFTASLPPVDREATLEKDPSRHIGKALRMRVGERLCLFDGSGRECAARISRVTRDAVTVIAETVTEVDRESPLRITLAIALSRGDRVETTVQKATELGVSEIWPFTSERTGLRLDAERMEKKRAHWQRIAVSACEQSGRNRIPEIADTTDLPGVLQRGLALQADLRVILHPEAATPADALPAQCQSLLLLIGPEGGFSEEEVAAAASADYAPLLLGPRVLRTETAPLAALAVAQYRWGDFLPVQPGSRNPD